MVSGRLHEFVTSATAGEAGWKVVKQLFEYFKQHPALQQNWQDFKNGAFLILNDEGRLYDAMGFTLGASACSTRLSSHQTGKQYRCPVGSSKAAVLVGTKQCDASRCSWVQLEGSSLHAISDVIMHGWDFLHHKVTGHNIGPEGSSQHTQRHPMTLEGPESWSGNVTGEGPHDYEGLMCEYRSEEEKDKDPQCKVGQIMRQRTRRQRRAGRAAAGAAAVALAHAVFRTRS